LCEREVKVHEYVEGLSHVQQAVYFVVGKFLLKSRFLPLHSLLQQQFLHTQRQQLQTGLQVAPQRLPHAFRQVRLVNRPLQLPISPMGYLCAAKLATRYWNL
jgi:hypothetical protein